MAEPHHRHQSSLESVIDPLATTLLLPHEHLQAVSIFQQIINYCGLYEQSHILGSERKYKRGKLLGAVFDYAISDHGRDDVLRYFLTAMTTLPHEDLGTEKHFPDVLASLNGFKDMEEIKKDQILNKIQELADHLVDFFFLPIRASGAKTPQPTPHMMPFPRPDESSLAGTTQRLSSLRADCLYRDRYRCVISRLFDAAEAKRRIKINGDDAVDTEGNLIADEDCRYLEVAHIIPHSLTSTVGQFVSLTQSKAYTLRILDMFDPGIRHLIEGTNIDRCYNALTLEHNIHRNFGELEVYFEASLDTPHKYTIKAVDTLRIFRPKLPITRDLFLTPDHNIDPPMPRLLAIHRACCLILHMSGAAEYIEKVIRDMEEPFVMSDGTTELGAIVSLRLQNARPLDYGILA